MPLRYNWVPFTEEEADFLAFGTKVAVDSAVAFQQAVRVTTGQGDFAIADLHSTDLRLVH